MPGAWHENKMREIMLSYFSDTLLWGWWLVPLPKSGGVDWSPQISSSYDLDHTGNVQWCWLVPQILAATNWDRWKEMRWWGSEHVDNLGDDDSAVHAGNDPMRMIDTKNLAMAITLMLITMRTTMLMMMMAMMMIMAPISMVKSWWWYYMVILHSAADGRQWSV